MEALRKKAKELLASGAVKVVIGYGPGSTPDRSRPLFARTPADADKLILTDACVQNLATYLTKLEVKALGKPAVVCQRAGLRTLLQYAAENQLADESFIALAVTGGNNASAPGAAAGSGASATSAAKQAGAGEVKELPKLAAIEEHLATQPRGISEQDRAEIAKIDAMSREERWAFWQAEMARCIKCYACRAACPLCYCSRCVTDNNQPQWVPVASEPFGNLEWNIVRAMHLAGRCIDCGSCAAACPQNIRIDLLNHVLAASAQEQFAAEPGYTVRKEYALASFKPDDKEDFIR